jgi:protein-disulfide isomerase
MPAPGRPPSLARMATNKSSIRVQAPRARPNGRSGSSSNRLPTRLTPPRLLALVVAAAAVIAGILIGVSVAGSGTKSSPQALVGSAQTVALLSGIPQHGNVLGRPDAPVTLVEFGDPACPVCMRFAVGTLPALVQQYVRTGKVRLVYDGLAFVGPASENALRAIEAAAVQNRAWYVIDLLYRSQGDERTNWATDSFLRSLGEAVPGLDLVKMMKDRGSATTTSAIQATARKANAEGIHQTPTFFVGLTGQRLQQLSVQSLDLSAFTPTLDGLLGK